MSTRRTIYAIVLVSIVAALCIWVVRQSSGILQEKNRLVRRLRQALLMRTPCPDCNVLLVNLDTLRAPEMPCYGYARDTTPNLCGYAGNNMRFANFFTQTPFTLDSHMSIFTGLYPTTHHVLEALKDTLHPDIPTLTKTLKKNGYQTVWAGITDDINLPLDRGLGSGFDEFHSVDGMAADWASQYEKLLPKFLDEKPTFMFLHSYGIHSPYLVGNGPYRFLTRAYPDIPLTKEEFYPHSRAYYEFVLDEFIGRLSTSNTVESRGRNGTIVKSLEQALLVNDLSRARDITWEFPWYENYSLYMAWYYRRIPPGDTAKLEYLKTIYDERIYQVDQQLAPLIAFLNRPEVKKKTIVIFTSDNGEEFMEHGFFDHGWNIYNTSTHTPFIIAVPGMKNGVYHELVQAVDIMPTILDLVGVVPEGPLEGISLRPVMEGKGWQYAGDTYLVSQYSGNDIVSIRNSRWKMYRNVRPREYVELYDLMTDPLEQRNVLGDHPDRARLLDAALEQIMKRSPKYASMSGEFPSWLDQGKRDKLMFEGYF